MFRFSFHYGVVENWKKQGLRNESNKIFTFVNVCKLRLTKRFKELDIRDPPNTPLCTKLHRLSTKDLTFFHMTSLMDGQFVTCNLKQCRPLNWITDNRISRLLESEIAGPFISQQYTKHVG